MKLFNNFGTESNPRGYPGVVIRNATKTNPVRVELGLLLPEAQARNEFAIPGNILIIEVAEKSSSLTYQHQETAAACIVVLVLSEMPAELLNSLC